MAVKYSANPGLDAISIDGEDLGSAFGAGDEFALSIANQGTPNVTWQTVFAGGNPGSITVLLEGSLDGTSWSTIDTSTSTTGEIRDVSGSYKFIRINNSAVTVGAGITLTASFVYSSTISSGSGGSVAWGDITGTLSSQADLQTALDARVPDSDFLREQTVADVTNATVTMANLTALSITLAAIKYSFELVLYVNQSVAAEGLKVDFDGGAATMTNVRAHGLLYDAALLLSAQTSALATDLAQASFIGDGIVVVKGSMEVLGAGTFIPRFAKNSHALGTATVYRGSHLTITSME